MNNQDLLGYIVENRVLQSALYERLQELQAFGKVHLECPSTVKDIHFPAASADDPSVTVPQGAAIQSSSSSSSSADGLARVALGDGRVLRTRLVVGADGATSRVRSAAGVGTWGWDYDQRGVVATVRTSGALSTAWQRFLPNGPVAILPVSGAPLAKLSPATFIHFYR